MFFFNCASNKCFKKKAASKMHQKKTIQTKVVEKQWFEAYGSKRRNGFKKWVVKKRWSVRSEDSEGTTNRACNTGRDNKKRQVQNMDDAQHTLFPE